MDFKKAYAKGARFVFIKVSERGFIDRDFEYNWKAAKDAGLLRGGYHFLRWDLSGLLQARIFCEVMRSDPGELPPVADFEAPNQGSLYPSNALLEQFLVEVENISRRKPIIYTSPSFWNTHGRNKTTKQFDAKWAYYTLWIANYFKVYQPGVTKPYLMEPWKSAGKTWTFWQYTDQGDGAAYGAESKTIDLNWFNGSMEELKAFSKANKPSTPAPVKLSDAQIADLKKRIQAEIDAWRKTL